MQLIKTIEVDIVKVYVLLTVQHTFKSSSMQELFKDEKVFLSEMNKTTPKNKYVDNESAQIRKRRPKGKQIPFNEKRTTPSWVKV